MIARALFAFTLVWGVGGAAQGETREVALANGGLELRARLVVAAGKSLADGVFLITHGTLAHNRMEIIAALQDGLEERALNSLAINLSLGLAARASAMYDCAVPHRHKHEDALDEIGAWLAWLKGQGASRIILAGHSMGGNQTAWFAAERPDPALAGVALIAPSTWSAAGAAKLYRARHGGALSVPYGKAEKLLAGGKGAALMKPVGVFYCKDAEVSAASFVSYYQPDPRRHSPNHLGKIKVPVSVIAASEDRLIKGLIEAVETLTNDNVNLVVVDGAGHFFLDLYLEDVLDAMADLLAQ
jgi:pimeloyl-ACP methyl ester carboxylesterase